MPEFADIVEHRGGCLFRFTTIGYGKEWAMPNGTIKRLVRDRGFGFIAGDDGREYFFHRDGTENFDTLRGGESVTFQIEPSPKGPRAAHVRLN